MWDAVPHSVTNLGTARQPAAPRSPWKRQARSGPWVPVRFQTATADVADRSDGVVMFERQVAPERARRYARRLLARLPQMAIVHQRPERLREAS
jgi:hypothetical protein